MELVIISAGLMAHLPRLMGESYSTAPDSTAWCEQPGACQFLRVAERFPVLREALRFHTESSRAARTDCAPLPFATGHFRGYPEFVVLRATNFRSPDRLLAFLLRQPIALRARGRFAEKEFLGSQLCKRRGRMAEKHGERNTGEARARPCASVERLALDS